MAGPGRSWLPYLVAVTNQSHLSGMGLAEDTLGTQSPVCVPGPGIKARTGRSSASGSGWQSLKEAKVKAK